MPGLPYSGGCVYISRGNEAEELGDIIRSQKLVMLLTLTLRLICIREGKHENTGSFLSQPQRQRLFSLLSQGSEGSCLSSCRHDEKTHFSPVVQTSFTCTRCLGVSPPSCHPSVKTEGMDNHVAVICFLSE
jgi:hypothetical protein